MSRPTLYTTELHAKALQYAESFNDECLPTIEGLALHLSVARSTLYEWETQYAEFSDILECLRCKQAQLLITNGLTGKFNATMSKMMLSKHGYYEEKHPVAVIDPESRLIGITYIQPVEKTA